MSGWLRMPPNPDLWVWAKPPDFERAYEYLLAPLRDEPFALLELGVAQGDSLAMWADGFPRATIVGVDLELPERELGSRVHLVRGDQTDRELLASLRSRFAPEGFRVIIDDASHVGAVSSASLEALFVEHLQPGGLYVIEDWETGYFPAHSWPDSHELESRVDVATLAEETGDGRMPSHDAGMVGFVKTLIDHVGRGPLPIASVIVRAGMVILRKAV